MVFVGAVPEWEEKNHFYTEVVQKAINTPDFSEAIGPVPATLVQTANAEACRVDNRFDLTIPQVELTDSAGNKYTFSGVQHLHRLNGPPARTEGR